MHESGGPEQKREEPRLEDKTAAATTSMLHPDGVASVHPRFTNTNRSSTGKPRILGSFAPGSTGNCVCVRSGVSWRVGKWVGVLVHVLMLLFLLCWLCGPNVSLKSLKLKFLYNSLIHSAHGFRQRFQGIHLCSIIVYGLRLEESSV